MGLTYTQYYLDEAAVEAVSAAVQEYLNGLKMERRSVQRIRLTVEELLLNIMEGCGKGTEVSIGLGRQSGRHVLRIRYEGVSCDPTSYAEDTWADDLMRTLGVYPSWSFRGRTNTLSMVIADREKRGMIFHLGIAVLAAVLLGFLGRFAPGGLLKGIDETLLTPLSNAFLGLMTTFSGFLIAFTICSGILGVGDSATLGKIGKQVIVRYVGGSFLICAASVAVCALLLDLRFDAGGSGRISQLSEISAILFAIIPSNPVEPFQTGNTLQIVVISALVGIGILMIGDRGSRLRSLTNEATSLLQYVVTAIAGLIPLFVFTMLLRQIWFGDLKALLSVWKPLMMIGIADLVLTAVFCLWTAFRLHCGPLALLRKALPPFLIGLSTASSMAALTLSMETCETKIGIDRNLVSFAYPLGTVIAKSGTTASFSILACCFAEIYHLEVSFSWLVMTVLTVTLLVIAMPPIPGAGIMAYTVLFTRLGIPMEAMVIVAAAEVLIDFVDTGFNVLLLILRLSSTAGALGKVDRSVLQSAA